MRLAHMLRADFPGIVRNYSSRVLLYLTPRLMASAAQLVFLPIVLHSLTLRDYGLFSVASMIGNLVSLLSFPQLTFGSKIALARGLNGQFFYSLFKRTAISLPLLGVSTAILLVASGYIGWMMTVTVILVLAGTLLSNIVVQSVISLWVAKERFFTASMVELVRAVVVNGGGAIAAVVQRDLLTFVIARIAIDAAFSVAALLHAAVTLKLWAAYRRGEIDDELSAFGIKMFWANVAVMARTEGLSFIVAGHFGVEPLAIFRVAYTNIYSRIQNQLSSITEVIYAKNAREQLHVSTWLRFRQYCMLGILGLGTAILGCAASYIYIYYTLPAEYYPSFFYTAILMFALPLDVVYSYVNQLFLVRYDSRTVSRLLIAHLAIQLALLVALMIPFGVGGACVSVVLALAAALALGVFLERSASARRSADQGDQAT